MSDPQSQQQNIRSYKKAMQEKARKPTLSEAEINQIQRIAQENPDELRKVPAISGLQEALSMSEGNALASTLQGVVSLGLNEQYANVFKGVQRLNLPVLMIAQGIARSAYIKGRTAKGATELLTKQAPMTWPMILLISFITMFGLAALFNMATSPNFTIALEGGFYGIPNFLFIGLVLFLSYIFIRRRSRALS